MIFFVFGAARPFSGLFFRFLGLVLLTVKVMLVGVCCVAVYNTVEGESSSSQLSVALLSPPEERLYHSSCCTNSLKSALEAAYFFRSTSYPVSYYIYYLSSIEQHTCLPYEKKILSLSVALSIETLFYIVPISPLEFSSLALLQCLT